MLLPLCVFTRKKCVALELLGITRLMEFLSVSECLPPRPSPVVACPVLTGTGSRGPPVPQQHCDSQGTVEPGGCLHRRQPAVCRMIPLRRALHRGPAARLPPTRLPPPEPARHAFPAACFWQPAALPPCPTKGQGQVPPHVGDERMRRRSVVEREFRYPLEEEEGEIRTAAVTLGVPSPEAHPSFPVRSACC